MQSMHLLVHLLCFSVFELLTVTAPAHHPVSQYEPLRNAKRLFLGPAEDIVIQRVSKVCILKGLFTFRLLAHSKTHVQTLVWPHSCPSLYYEDTLIPQ